MNVDIESKGLRCNYCGINANHILRKNGDLVCENCGDYVIKDGKYIRCNSPEHVEMIFQWMDGQRKAPVFLLVADEPKSDCMKYAICFNYLVANYCKSGLEKLILEYGPIVHGEN